VGVADVDTAVAAIRAARAQARALRLKWAPLPTDVALPVDIDATILIAHSAGVRVMSGAPIPACDRSKPSAISASWLPSTWTVRRAVAG